MISPPTVTNKGQSRGVIEYTVIEVIMKEHIGKSKITNFSVGIRKRTSGHDTGYLVISVHSESGALPAGPGAVAIEFWNDPDEWLKKLFDNEIKKYI